MVICKICGKKFKSAVALGGHMVNAHPNQKAPSEIEARAQPTEEITMQQKASEEEIGQELQPNKQVVPSEGNIEKQEPQQVEDDKGVAAEMREYIKRGYTFEQLTKTLGFAPTTARRELAKSIPPEGSELAKPGDGLPVTRKTGGGAEITTPEAVLRSFMDGNASDALELRGMMKLRAAMLMVMDLVNIRKADSDAYALMVKPILEMMQETRTEQDAAAERAKASNMDIANQAAQRTSLNMANFIDQKIPKGPPPKDTSEMFTKRIDKMWEMMEHMMEQRMMPGYQQGEVPEGWESEKRRNEQ